MCIWLNIRLTYGLISGTLRTVESEAVPLTGISPASLLTRLPDDWSTIWLYSVDKGCARTMTQAQKTEKTVSDLMLLAIEEYAQLAGCRKLHDMESYVCNLERGRVTL